MKTLLLSQNRSTLLDDEDFAWASIYNWHISEQGYVLRKHKQTNVSMHREILNAPIGVEVDHINGDKSDNRRSNLRLCTHAQNMRNRGPQKNNTSGYKGVSWRGIGSYPWEARITAGGRQMFLGTFKTAETAADAYNQAASKAHKDYARLNEIK